MRARSVVSEALRNLATGTTRAALFGAVLAVLAGSLAIVDARSVIDLRGRAGAFVASGATVQVLVARRMTDAASCEGLSRVNGVRAAGALREGEPVVLRAMFANPVPAFTVTPGLLRLLGEDPGSGTGAWLPEELAETLRVTAGSRLETTAGTLTVAGTYAHPDDGRDSRLAYAVLLPRLPEGAFDECWVDAWPISQSARRTMYAAVKVDGESTEPVNIEQLNAGMGTEFDGAAQFAARATRHTLPACAVAGFVLGFAAVRRRRLELAGALHVGMPAWAIMAMTLIETAAWALAAFALAAFALAVTVVMGTPVDVWQIYLIDVRGPAAAGVAAPAGAACAALTIRERHLFRYFKDRS